MDIIQGTQRNITSLLKFRQTENQHFGGSTGIQSVANDRSRLEYRGRVFMSSHFRGTLVFNAGAHAPPFEIKFQD
jgi:hypothetical protein